MTAAPEERFTRLRGKVAIAPVHAVCRALENPFVAEQQLVLDFEQPVHGNIRGVVLPVHLDATDAPRRRAVPRLGGYRAPAQRAWLFVAGNQRAATAGGGVLSELQLRVSPAGWGSRCR
jgi:crotonobetainyl-CoA:carnitine CoA-transferase CaiB-like acyl-CoA transferase